MMGPRTRLATVLALAAVSLHACQKTTTEATPPLGLSCSANPAAGSAPLTVAFALDVAHALGTPTISISYGDGTQGTDPDARHVYATAGDFVASFTVTAGTETARCSVPVSVAPGLAPTPPPAALNSWPDAWFVTNPSADVYNAITGKAPLSVSFNMCRSSDPDGDRLSFRMDLEGDGVYELVGVTGADCRHQTTYAVGARTATICVTDVDCPDWPSCERAPKFHPYQCMSYTVTATP